MSIAVKVVGRGGKRMVLDIIVKFVEGKMTAKEFQEELNTNDELVKLLKNNIANSLGSGEDLYEAINSFDIDTIGGLYDILGVMKYFLSENQILYKENDEIEKLYTLLLAVQPAWLDLPDWYMDKLINKFESQSGKELKDSMKAQIIEDFRYLKKPRWLQSPDWLFVDERPLLFIGQLDIKELRCDTAQVYVFLDEETDTYHFTEQFT